MGSRWQVRAWAPGRTEVAGNHVDHQGGRVLNAALDTGITVLARSNGSKVAHVESQGYKPFDVDLATLDPVSGERNTSVSLVRGVAAGLKQAGIEVGGFDTQIESTLPSGGGMSSSAAFEMAMARAMLALFAEDDEGPDAVNLARLSRIAERDYFGKPCGLQDQVASALGGMNLIDFADESHLAIEPIDFDFEQAGYAIVLVDTKCDHSAHTEDFNRIQIDMCAVARFFGKDVLRFVPRADFEDALPEVRSKLGDVAALRALHFYNEMDLVDKRVAALRARDMASFLAGTRMSSASSAQYLQNVSVAGQTHQPAMVAIALASQYVGEQGASRIHGGGFGGTVQVFMPEDMVDGFCRFMDRTFAPKSCLQLRQSTRGAYAELL